jgi:hypothetical protein
MLTWILIAVAVTLVSGLVVGSRNRARALVAHAAPPQLERTIRDLRANDVVQHGGKDYLVEGVVIYDEDGHGWRNARMVDAGKEAWLLVGLERTGLTARVLEVATGLEVTGYPPETLEHGGIAYKLAQRGTATVTFQGDLAGLPGATDGGSTRCRWWRYQAAGEKALILEQWGETYRGLVGQSVPPADVDLLGAS